MRNAGISWMRALAAKKHEAVLNAILMEPFLQQVPPEARMYLYEGRVATVKEESAMVENYSLAARPAMRGMG